MIPLGQAQALVLGGCRPVPPSLVPIDRALGCVAAARVTATEPVPPFMNSSRDGYALRAGDTTVADAGAPVHLDVVGSIMAGGFLDRPIGPGQAVRIMTGAPLPPGADAVCMLEDCVDEADGEVVVIGHPLAIGEAVRHAGEDVRVGDVVIEAGTVLTPAHLGVLANQGLDQVRIHPRPRVGVLSTGDELVSGPAPLAPGQIRDANRHTLLAMVHREGWDAVDLGIVGDDEDELGDALDRAAVDCDAIVTSGGVSVGDLDNVKVVLEKRSGGTMRWMQVAIRPAKPFAFGTLESSLTPVFGLPGNPVSAMVSFELFVRPGVRRIAGHRVLHRVALPAVTDVGLPRTSDGKIHFVRAAVRLEEDGRWRLRPVVGQDSHQLLAMAQANALAVLPDGQGVAAGGTVAILLTDTEGIAPAGDGVNPPW
jgi:molybdopterin molybdotransferase